MWLLLRYLDVLELSADLETSRFPKFEGRWQEILKIRRLRPDDNTFSRGIVLNILSDITQQLTSFLLSNCITNNANTSSFDTINHLSADIVVLYIHKLHLGENRRATLISFPHLFLDDWEQA